MIITCPCGEKKFEIDAALIPNEGRTLKCGSCDHVWFYKKEEQIDNYEIEEKTLEISDKSTTTKTPIKSNILPRNPLVLFATKVPCLLNTPPTVVASNSSSLSFLLIFSLLFLKYSLSFAIMLLSKRFLCFVD